jgi:hypothetical protein
MRTVFERDLAGARVAARTGYGPRFFGEMSVPEHEGLPGRAFAMERVEGSFPIAEEGAAPAALAEAGTALAALSRRTIEDVRGYGDELIRLGYHCSGEVQGLIAPDGRWRPIDFQGIDRLPTEEAARIEAMENHARNLATEVEQLEGLLASRPAAGR